ncbi:NudC domain-containing protein 2 [Microtus ochrogaster]|uniref:NudC domain-containing protein 2 n=1 Tax=Microtus ochrogaster TaxID=79684 RepID=A0A8J6G3A9_MICOH|nr:NudC domain-containing protein 2 [Microtus ochrogaster]
MSAPFEERSGVVPCGTPWGQWYQTLEEVFIEVQVPPGTRAQDIQCGLQSRHVALAVGGREIFKVASQGLSRVSFFWPPRTPSPKIYGFRGMTAGWEVQFLAGRKELDLARGLSPRSTRSQSC